MENRRLLLAALLSMTVMIAWTFMIESLRSPTPVSSKESSEVLSTDETSSAEALDSSRPLDIETFESELEFSSELIVGSTESHPTIETAAFRAEFTNRGAQLVSLQLNKHWESDGEPLELVRSRGSDPYPFALVINGRNSHRLNGALFDWTLEETENGIVVLRFRHRSELGTAEKVFRTTQLGFLEVEISVEGTQDWGVVFGPSVRRFNLDTSNQVLANQLASSKMNDNDSVEYRAQKIGEDIFLPAGDLTWVTLEDNFFLTAVLPRQGFDEVVIRPVFQRVGIRAEEPRFLPIETEIEDVSREILLLLESQGSRLEFLTFFGAKQYRHLAELPYGLEETVRWGFLGFVTRPLYFALEWIHANLVANYGWAIVLVTILIRLIFFPLTFKSQESMAKMQEINPKVQAIKSKYRGKLKDKQGRPNFEAHRAMQEEQSALLREAGVNPAASCLPLLLQMPVFFAFFQLLSKAVELRNAEWIGWIDDLAAKDPFFVLPVFMGITSVAMQRMMPVASDPIQRRIIQLMPIMFMIFALNFASGLVLYWVTNNLLSMLQQWIMLRLKKGKRVEEVLLKKTKA